MDAKHINPFLKMLESILEQYGIKGIKKGAVTVKKEMSLSKDVTAFVGIFGEIRGSVSYSFDSETAKRLISKMVMDMPVTEIDELGRSAVAELANMITGNAISVFNTNRILADITPPTVVTGQDIFFIVGTVTTLSVILETDLGEVEVNFGLES
jgi:chemotaxis protein CheX